MFRVPLTEMGVQQDQSRPSRATNATPTRLTVVGGFLGAGKTTALLRLARMHAARGRRVGVIANDLGDGLVDAAAYRAAGLPVEEMPGVCFSCRFDELIAAAGRLQDGARPDVLLAEPAGSCTDLVAGVFEPLRQLYRERFVLGPYAALLDPRRAREALTASGPGGFSKRVTYLYRMQQNEAELIAINKCDVLNAEALEQVAALVRTAFPRAEVLTISAREGTGFDELFARLERPSRGAAADADRSSADVSADDRSMPLEPHDGEGDLAWLSARVELTADAAFDVSTLLTEFLRRIQDELRAESAAIGHVKVATESGPPIFGSLTQSDETPEVAPAPPHVAARVVMLINARVQCGVSMLQDAIVGAVRSVAGERSAGFDVNWLSATAVAAAERQCAIDDGPSGSSNSSRRKKRDG